MSDFDVQHRDCFDSLAAMRDAGGVDLILTSPPYPDARTPEAYGAEFDTSLAGLRQEPTDFARALADCMHTRVVAAQRYLDEHRDLEQLGMPIEIVRHALDRPTIETGPLAALGEWNGKGLLGLHGARDNGKTHAAAVWALRRLRAGRRTAWVSCPGLLSFEVLDAALARVAKAPAVVLDDIGPGLGGTDGFRVKLTAWIQERGQLPTVLTSNANEAQLEQYLGARLLSRMKQAGELRHFEAEAGLREVDEEVLDEHGRGKFATAATWRVWRFGCEPDDHVEAGRVVHGYRVGDALEQARLTIEQLHELATYFGLAIDVVEARAVELAAEAERVRGLMDRWSPPPMKSAAKMSEIIERAKGDLDEAPRGSPPAPALQPRPEWAGKAELRELGFEVTRKRPGSKVMAASFRVLCRGKIVHAGIADEAEGWRIAAGLLDPVTLPPGTCSSPDYYQRTQAIREAALARRGPL